MEKEILLLTRQEEENHDGIDLRSLLEREKKKMREKVRLEGEREAKKVREGSDHDFREWEKMLGNRRVSKVSSSSSRESDHHHEIGIGKSLSLSISHSVRKK